MDGTVAIGEAALAVEEARLARAAAAGDGSAFAALYERYEQRAFNLAYRIAGSEADAADAVQDAFLNVMRRLPRLADRELAFGSYLFTATRNACYDLMRQQRRTRPSETIPESAAPLGSGAGGLGLDPGDPEEDPDRKVLLESQQEEIREASMRLPERQREALALRELEELSYDEIATIMELNRNSVAQLISRARINLRDELRGTALASIAAPSPECERALPLIATRDDGQLEAGSRDAAWLDAHLGGCERCRLGVEAMQEAGASYRAWAPIAAAPWLLEETMAKAAEQAGVDWSEEIAEAVAARTPAESLPGMPSAYLAGHGRPPRRRLTLAAGLAALLLSAGLATALLAGDDPPPTPADPAAGAAPGPSVAAPEPGAKPGKQGKAGQAGKTTGSAAKKKRRARSTAAGTPAAETTAAATTPAPGPAPTQAPTGDPAPSDPASRPNRPTGKTAVQPTRRTSPPRPRPTPKPAPTPTPQPGAAPAPPVEEPPAAEEPPEEPPRQREPPGKPADRPPQR